VDNDVPLANADPPEEAVYHCIAVPVALNPATVGLELVQNDCAEAVGADTNVIVPEALTFCVVALVLEHATLPDGVPEALVVVLT